MSKNKPVRMWVDPLFKKKLKKEACEQDISLVDLTEQKGKNDKKKKFSFDFV